MGEKSKKALLIDGHSLLHRAFYALPTLTTSQGEYTNAILGFTMMLMRLLEDEQPDYIGVAFDEKAPTFRHKEYTDYKGHRKPMPEELRPQVPLVREVVEAFNIPVVSLAGYEADDVIGTAARKASDLGYVTYIVTGDKDCLQLIDDNTRALITRQGIKDLDLYDGQKVMEKFGVTPEQIPDFKGLTGDKSDNIPGVPGIGPKTAAKLLQTYGSLPGVLEHLDELKGKQKETIAEHTDDAEMSLRLAIIDCNVPIEIDFSRYVPDEWNVESLRHLFSRFEFRQLLDRLARKYPEAIKAAADEKLQAEQGAENGQGELFREENKDRWDMVVVHEGAELDAILERAQREGILLVDLYLEGTDAVSGRLAAIGVGTRGGASLIPIRECFEAWGKGLTLDQALRTLEPLLADQALVKVAYDIKPLLVTLKRESREDAEGIFDAALAGYLCNPSQATSNLEDLVLQYFDTYVPPLSELTGTGAKAKGFGELSPEDLLEYTERRLRYLELLYEKLTNKLEEDGLLELFETLETPLINVLAAMELTGITVDTNELLEISEELEERIEALTQSIYDKAGEEFNINSPKQLGSILFEKLGLPVLKKTKTGPSTSAEVLEQLAEEHEVVDEILGYRQLVKLKSTYVDALGALVNPETGRVHTSFNQMVTATGRLSSTNPNLQNIPIRTEEGRRIRSAFIPGEADYVILSADYSQIELRVLAHMSGDANLIEAFVNDQDIHTRTASEVFEVPLGDVSSQMRSAAKAINFGIVYGISSFGLAKGTGLTRQDAQKYIDSYFERYPGVKHFLDWMVEEARAKGYVTTLMNRRRYIPDIKSRNWNIRSFAERTAMNTPIQGSAADIIKKAMLEVHDRLQKSNLRAKLLLQVHDELVLEAAEADLDSVVEMLKEAMESVIELAVPLKADVKVGPNWKNTTKLEL